MFGIYNKEHCIFITTDDPWLNDGSAFMFFILPWCKSEIIGHYEKRIAYLKEPNRISRNESIEIKNSVDEVKSYL